MLPNKETMPQNTRASRKPQAFPRTLSGVLYCKRYPATTTRTNTHHLGHRARENSKRLTRVDLHNTDIHILHTHTFAQCHSLVTIWLRNCLSEFEAEVFVGCNALERLTLPELESMVSICGSMPLKDASLTSTASQARIAIELPRIAD